MNIDTAQMPPGEPGTAGEPGTPGEPGDGSAAMAGLIGRLRFPAGYRRVFLAAIEAFAERGFHGTSTRDIAARAGMSPAALYVHFGAAVLRIVGARPPADTAR